MVNCICLFFRSFRVVDDMRDDSLKLESGNLTSELTPVFTDWGGDPRCGE